MGAAVVGAAVYRPHRRQQRSARCFLNQMALLLAVQERMRMRLFIVRLMVLAASLLGSAAPSAAQVYTGRIVVTVTDTSGAVLPGATVDLAGPRTVTATT